ncbi:MAG: 50S ribosomal protein L4 [Verrucomicrobiota bacterium]
MSVSVLTIEAAKAAGVPVVENGRYTQALHDVVVAYRAARRSGTACTKSKADVNLSGSKPWRQKGTGRARAGYKSSPVWVGGGVVFGPKPRDYRKQTSKTVRRIALNKALSLRIKAGDIVAVPAFEVTAAKTKDFVKLVSSIVESGSVLVVSDSFTENTYLAGRNVEDVQLVRSADVNAEELLRYKKIIVTQNGITEIAKRINS